MKNLKLYQKTIAIVLAAGFILGFGGCKKDNNDITPTITTTFEHQDNYLKGYIEKYLNIVFVKYPDNSQGYRLVETSKPDSYYNYGEILVHDFITGQSQEEMFDTYTIEPLLPYLIEYYGDKSTYTYEEIINTFNTLTNSEQITEENTKEYVLTNNQQ